MKLGLEGKAEREMQELVTGNNEESVCKGRSFYKEGCQDLEYSEVKNASYSAS